MSPLPLSLDDVEALLWPFGLHLTVRPDPKRMRFVPAAGELSP